MAKRFRLRICRVIATTLQSCRSKDPSNLPISSNPKHQTPFISIAADGGLTASQPPLFKWQKEDKWHVVARIHQPRLKIFNSSASDGDQPPPLSSAEKNTRRRKKKKKKKNVPSRLRLSTSSAESGWFSSEGRPGDKIDEEETETLVSSSSSEFNPTSDKRSKRRISAKRTKRGALRPAADDGEVPARLSMFKKLIPCTVDGKVKESFAIVKRSEDPYMDFKRSMMDMILEKQMFEQKDLEQLLQCFLSLNSTHYHHIILLAFSEIWEAIFSKPSAHHHRRPLVSTVASF